MLRLLASILAALALALAAGCGGSDNSATKTQSKADYSRQVEQTRTTLSEAFTDIGKGIGKNASPKDIGSRLDQGATALNDAADRFAKIAPPAEVRTATPSSSPACASSPTFSRAAPTPLARRHRGAGEVAAERPGHAGRQEDQRRRRRAEEEGLFAAHRLRCRGIDGYDEARRGRPRSSRPTTLDHLLGTYGYAAVLAFVMVESIGIPFPGETMVIAAALYAGATHHLDVELIWAAAAAGAIIGDTIGFGVGHWGGYRLLLRHGHLVRIDEGKLKLGRLIFARPGGKVVFFGRFVSVLRTYAAFLAAPTACPTGASSRSTPRAASSGRAPTPSASTTSGPR